MGIGASPCASARARLLVRKESYIMAIPYRTGAPSLIKVGKRLCDLINKFGPILIAAYPENTLIAGLLNTAMAACSALTTELEQIRGRGD